LLFGLSLVRFVASWMGGQPQGPLTTAIYGVALLCTAIAYTILVRVIIPAQGAHSKLNEAVGNDLKGIISVGLYVGGIVCALVSRHEIAWVFYAVVALIWLVPDGRIERVL